MQSIEFVIAGISPLMMHNERLANPLDLHAKSMKKITEKKKKTDEDHQALAYEEFLGGIYHSDGAPYIPLRCIEACVRDGARITKRGKDVQRGITALGLDEERAEFIYNGPKDLDGLYKAGFFDQRTVKVGMQRVVRTRPKFNAGWKVKFTLAFDTEVFNRETVLEIVETAGKMSGLGDYRPRYGKFVVEKAV